MYAIVKNVTRPPLSSRARVEPRAEMLKKRSSALLLPAPPGRAGAVEVFDMPQTVVPHYCGAVSARQWPLPLAFVTDPVPDDGDGGRERLRPVSVSMTRVMEVGLALWAVALAVTLLVPALREGPRAWWPWCAAAGLGLGTLGYAHVRHRRVDVAGAARADRP